MRQVRVNSPKIAAALQQNKLTFQINDLKIWAMRQVRVNSPKIAAALQQNRLIKRQVRALIG